MRKILTFLVILVVGLVSAFADIKKNEFGVSYGSGSNDSYLNLKEEFYTGVDNYLNTVDFSYGRKIEINEYTTANGTPYITYTLYRGCIGFNYIDGDIDSYQYSDCYISSDSKLTLAFESESGIENDYVGISISSGVRLRLINCTVKDSYYGYEAYSTMPSLENTVKVEAFFKPAVCKIGIFTSFSPIRYDFGCDIKMDGKTIGKFDSESKWFTNGQFGLFSRVYF